MAHRSVLLFLNKLVFFFKKKILFGSFGFALLRVASLSSGNSGVSVHAAHELVRLVTGVCGALMLWTMLAVPVAVVTLHLLLCATLVVWTGVCAATVLFPKHEHQL
jgi:hypothetical protein